jgi:hypothetical protein
MRWIDSTVGIDDLPPLNFGPVVLNTAAATATANGKHIEISKVTGLPSRVSIDPEPRRMKRKSEAPMDVLAAPVQLDVIQRGSAVRWCAEPGGFTWTKQATGVVAWSAVSVSCATNSLTPTLRLQTNGTLEFDGFMDFRVRLTCSVGECELDAVDLNISFSESATKYAMGMAERGQEWPPADGHTLQWEWAEAQNATAHNAAAAVGWLGWVGAVSHGMRLKLKGPETVWDEPANPLGLVPVPIEWAAGNGSLSLSGSVLSAQSGAR